MSLTHARTEDQKPGPDTSPAPQTAKRGPAGPSGGFTASPGSPHSAVSGGVSPRFPANTDGKGDTPEGIG